MFHIIPLNWVCALTDLLISLCLLSQACSCISSAFDMSYLPKLTSVHLPLKLQALLPSFQKIRMLQTLGMQSFQWSNLFLLFFSDLSGKTKRLLLYTPFTAKGKSDSYKKTSWNQPVSRFKSYIETKKLQVKLQQLKEYSKVKTKN